MAFWSWGFRYAIAGLSAVAAGGFFYFGNIPGGVVWVASTFIWMGSAVIGTPKRWRFGDKYYTVDYRFRWVGHFGCPKRWPSRRIKEDDHGHRQGKANDPSRTSGGTGPDKGTSTPITTHPGSIGEPGEGIDPELTIPDSAEAIVGWREWATSRGLLTGFHDVTWPAGTKLKAKHAKTPYDEMRFVTSGRSLPKCNAPALGCSCGIYALNKPSGNASGVFGEINLWGRVIQGERGWRAQYAYPKRIWVTIPSFKPVETAIACVEDADERVKDAVEAKLAEVKKQYADDYFTLRRLADQLRDNYGVPVDLHDPDQPHPLVEQKSLEIAS